MKDGENNGIYLYTVTLHSTWSLPVQAIKALQILVY